MNIEAEIAKLGMTFATRGRHVDRRNRFSTVPGSVKLSEQGPQIDPADLERLEFAICEALAAADRLGLSVVGIHLCNALELVKQQRPLPAAIGGSSSCH